MLLDWTQYIYQLTYTSSRPIDQWPEISCLMALHNWPQSSETYMQCSLFMEICKQNWDFLTFTHHSSHQQPRVAVLSEWTWFTYWHLSLCCLPQALRLRSWSSTGHCTGFCIGTVPHCHTQFTSIVEAWVCVLVKSAQPVNKAMTTAAVMWRLVSQYSQNSQKTTK